MHRLVLLADTHVPARARGLPPEVEAAVRDLSPGDLVVHAGDWVEEQVLDGLLAVVDPTGADLLGCWGNNDGPALRRRLPEIGRTTVAGLRVAVVHETGAATGRNRRLAAAFGHDTDLLVFGHSHIPWDATVAVPGGQEMPGGAGAAGVARALRLLNPGSPTDRRRQPSPTFVTAGVAEPGGQGSVPASRLVDVELHRLLVRSAATAARPDRRAALPR